MQEVGAVLDKAEQEEKGSDAEEAGQDAPERNRERRDSVDGELEERAVHGRKLVEVGEKVGSGCRGFGLGAGEGIEAERSVRVNLLSGDGGCRVRGEGIHNPGAEVLSGEDGSRREGRDFFDGDLQFYRLHDYAVFTLDKIILRCRRKIVKREMHFFTLSAYFFLLDCIFLRSQA